jgi:hypothetical protein
MKSSGFGANAAWPFTDDFQTSLSGSFASILKRMVTESSPRSRAASPTTNAALTCGVSSVDDLLSAIDPLGLSG